MRLIISTPSSLVVDAPDVVALRAEDETGGFGIMPGHADFLTALTICVVGFRRAGGEQGYCAVRGGTLLVSGGTAVDVATRDAMVSEDLDRLEHVVLDAYRTISETERAARLGSTQLHMKAIRQIINYLRPDRSDELGAGL
ncbi:MAG: F0F1 ATP synthase subunit epsilon [Xanthobacteraceae bacterium]|nr:F0F1 ATP synthase subunit epsilon [Xanthobacteraceae bacterium]